MQDIVPRTKTDTGITVAWSEGGPVKDRSFMFKVYLEMQIDVDDLLGRPMFFKTTMELNNSK